MRLHVSIRHTLTELTGEMTFEVKLRGDEFEVTPGVFWSVNSIWQRDIVASMVSMLSKQAVIFTAVPGRRDFYSADSGIETHWRRL